MPNKLGGYQYLKSISIDEPPMWELVRGKSNIREAIHCFQKQFMIHNDAVRVLTIFLMEIRFEVYRGGVQREAVV